MIDFPIPSTPAPSSPSSGVTEDGVTTWGEMDEECWEVIPGINPMTGEPDGRYDGTVRVSVHVNRLEDAIHAVPSPSEPQLVTATRSSDLMVAQDLGIGLSQLAEDERLRRQADQLRRGLFLGEN